MRIDRVKLITIMAEKEISASTLSKISGITTSTISNIRSGKTCTYKTAARLANALGVTIDTLEKRCV